ncbi:MAG: carboxypeptidase-like regulatory domain-containing protein [Candidatus Margulisbacteria bacterium]|nr:carboxypeptidase-like regulatory domain-containing protein [Candidatus Margulisiibacteriota bacterium]
MANLRFKYWFLVFGCLLFTVYCLLVVSLSGCGDDNVVASIEVSPSSATIGINKAYAFSAVGRNSAGFLVAITPTWSADAAIGSIISTGLFTASGASGEGKVTATSGAISGTASVTITTNGWLTGNVTDTNGSLVIGTMVYLKENRTLYNGETNNSGDYLISGIPPGTYEARIDANGRTQSSAVSAEVTITSGETVTQDFIVTVPTTTSTTTTLF